MCRENISWSRRDCCRAVHDGNLKFKYSFVPHCAAAALYFSNFLQRGCVASFFSLHFFSRRRCGSSLLLCHAPILIVSRTNTHCLVATEYRYSGRSTS